MTFQYVTYKSKKPERAVTSIKDKLESRLPSLQSFFAELKGAAFLPLFASH